MTPPMRRRPRAPCRAAWLLALTAQAAHAQSVPAEELLQRPAGLTVEQVVLEQALTELQRTSGVRIAFSPDLLPTTLSVTCACAGVTVREALTRLLARSGLAFSATRTQVLITPAASPPRGLRGGGTIVGAVREAGTHRPVVDAWIGADGDPRVVTTDADGRFVIPGLGEGSHDLTATGIGFRPRAARAVPVRAGDTTRVTLDVEPAVVDLADVVVTPGSFAVLEGARAAVVQQTMTREDIETVPQVGEDAFRVMQRLPGVASDDISTKLNVRGGTDEQLLVLFDGLRLYEPYHLKDFDGALGIVDVAALGGIDLLTGGFSAEYGDRMVGVFNMTSRPPPDHTRTALGASLTNLTLQSQGQFADGAGDWLVSARRGYLDIVLAISGGDNLSPQYYDTFGKVEFSPWPNHVFGAHALYARDHLKLDARTDPTVSFTNGRDLLLNSSWGSGYAWLTWTGSFGTALTGRAVISAGRLTQDRSGDGSDPGRLFGPEAISVSDVRAFDVAEARQSWGLALSPRVLLKAGTEVRVGRADYDYARWTRSIVPNELGELTPRTDSTRLLVTPSGTSVGGYLAARFRPWDALTTEIGARYDRSSLTRTGHVAPRLLAAWTLGDATTIRASWGDYVQSQGVQELQVADGDTAFSRAERADQIALGVEHRLASGVNLRLETYRRVTADPRPAYVSLSRELDAFPEVEDDRVLLAPSRSRAWGVELLAQRERDRGLSWATSYVLSFADDRLAGEWVPRALDQRHTVVIRAVYRPWSPWQISWAWQYHSGWPITQPVFGVDTLTSGTLRVTEGYAAVNDARLPAYHRLDARITRVFPTGSGRVMVYFDVFNLYNRRNARNYEYDISLQSSSGTLAVRRHVGAELIPRLPSVGVRWEF